MHYGAPTQFEASGCIAGTPHKHYAAHTKLGAGEASAVWWVERYAPFCLAICDTSLVACCWPAENTLDTAFLSTRRRSPKSQTDRARRILPVTSCGRLRKAQITTRETASGCLGRFRLQLRYVGETGLAGRPQLVPGVITHIRRPHVLEPVTVSFIMWSL